MNYGHRLIKTMTLKNYKNDLFINSRDKWLSGKWHDLRLLDIEKIHDHSERQELALFVASAWQQINNVDKVRLYISIALEWGCSKFRASQFLIAGLFNTLGCLKALQNQKLNLLPIFQHAIDINAFSNLDSSVLAELRLRHEFSNLNIKNSSAKYSLLDKDFNTKEPIVSLVSNLSKSNIERDNQQLLVIGMHRSGTSCITNLLKNMGAYFGSNDKSTGTNEENPKGFWERRDMRHITDTLLFSVNADWHKVSDFHTEKISNEVNHDALRDFDIILDDLNKKKSWVLKEPRLSLLLPLLRNRLDRPIAVCVYRNPLEVALSLQKRNGFPINFGLALWEFYTLSILKNTSDMDRIFISYNGLMEDPIKGSSQICTALNELGTSLTTPKDSDLLYLLDGNLYRNKIYSYELEGTVTIRQLRLYEDLRNSSNYVTENIDDSLRESIAFYEKTYCMSNNSLD